jgi:hypothetical protein
MDISMLQTSKGDDPGVNSSQSRLAASIVKSAAQIETDALLEAFISKYCIERLQDQQSRVSITIPTDTSYIGFLKEAQALSESLHLFYPRKYRFLRAIDSDQLQKWESNKCFLLNGSGLKVVTDARLAGSSGGDMDRNEQAKLLLKNKLAYENLAGLAVAHTACYVLDGVSLFDGAAVRAEQGTLFFHFEGLAESVDDLGRGYKNMYISARIPNSEIEQTALKSFLRRFFSKA